MPPAAVPDAFKLALQHHQAGRLPEASALYRQVLALQPNPPGALHLLGVLALQTGQFETATKMIAQAVALDPGNADAVYGLAEAARNLKLNSEAADNYRIYLDAVPDGPKAKAARKALVALGEAPKK